MSMMDKLSIAMGLVLTARAIIALDEPPSEVVVASSNPRSFENEIYKNAPRKSSVIDSAVRSMPAGVKLESADAIAVVLVAEQRMVVRVGGKEFSYRVSTAKAGEGSKAGSGKTPLGWHKVKSRFGSRAKVGQLFVSRKAVKGAVRTEKDWRFGNGDEVLSRIFWLEGLELGLNKDPKGNYDSYLRYIYIHGTNQEELLGKPASHGCIRMGNRDVVELFDRVSPCKNFYVFIKGRGKVIK